VDLYLVKFKNKIAKWRKKKKKGLNRIKKKIFFLMRIRLKLEIDHFIILLKSSKKMEIIKEKLQRQKKQIIKINKF
jgi:hypothetical protein